VAGQGPRLAGSGPNQVEGQSKVGSWYAPGCRTTRYRGRPFWRARWTASCVREPVSTVDPALAELGPVAVPALLELLAQGGGDGIGPPRLVAACCPSWAILDSHELRPGPGCPPCRAGVCRHWPAGRSHPRGGGRRAVCAFTGSPPAEPACVNAEKPQLHPRALGLLRRLAAAGRCLAELLLMCAGIGSTAPWRGAAGYHGDASRSPAHRDRRHHSRRPACATQGFLLCQSGRERVSSDRLSWPRCGCATWAEVLAIGAPTSHGIASSPRRRHLPVGRRTGHTCSTATRDAASLGFSATMAGRSASWILSSADANAQPRWSPFPVAKHSRGPLPLRHHAQLNASQLAGPHAGHWEGSFIRLGWPRASRAKRFVHAFARAGI